MSRIGNARTIADFEYVIDPPSAGGQNAWSAHGVDCTRDRHRFTGQEYAFTLEVLSLRSQSRSGWHVVILSETWHFKARPTEARTTKSLKVLRGKPAEVLGWMRRHRAAKLEKTRPANAPDGAGNRDSG
jgi:hypothetical protein